MARIDGLLSWNMKCGLAKTTAEETRRRLDLLGAMVAEHSVSLVALQEAPLFEEIRAALGVNFTVERTPKRVATAYDNRRWTCDVQEFSEPRVLVLGLRATGAGSWRVRP